MDRDRILLTPGPLTTTLRTKLAMLKDWGSWDADFNAVTASVRSRLLDIVGGHGSHVVVPLQGSGTFSVEAAVATVVPRDGHVLADRAIVTDDVELIQAQVKKWIDDPRIEAVITTGGTGVTGRDVTPEALEALFEKRIDGFGEVFRWISFQKIGTSTMQSRATAGVANATYIFALPGSTGACRDGWDDILRQQLDIRFRPCNFAELMPRLNEGRLPRSG